MYRKAKPVYISSFQKPRIICQNPEEKKRFGKTEIKECLVYLPAVVGQNYDPDSNYFGQAVYWLQSGL